MEDIVKISIVSTLYRSAQFIDEFYRRMKENVKKHTDSFEIIFVDDGSPDNSNYLVQQLVKKDSRVILVELSRNFGHHHAIMAGLSHATGDLVFLIDSDLEEQPEWISLFLEHLNKDKVDVVFGIQRQRVGGWFRKYTGNCFYTLFNSLSDIKIPNNPCTVRLMTRNYVESLLNLKESNLFLAGNFAWAGFRQKSVVVDKLECTKRRSNYNLVRLIKLFFNAVTSFSSYPLIIVFITGLVLSLLAGLFGIQILIYKILYPEAFQLGYSSIMISIWFLGGLIILFVGVVGLYLSKVFNEVKSRPQFIIRKVYRGE